MKSGSETSLSAPRSTLISTLIIGALGLQLFAGFLPVLLPGIGLDPRLWPFLSYGMYSEAYRAGDSVDEILVVAVLEDGTETEIQGRDVDMNLWGFQALIYALQEDDLEVVKEFVTAYEDGSGATIAELRLDSRPILIERDGPSVQPQRTLKRVPLGPGEIAR